MPRYKYYCQDCDTNFLVFHSMSEKQEECVQCLGNNISKSVTSPSYVEKKNIQQKVGALTNKHIAITTLSVLFNIFITGYTRKAITELLSISEELGDIQEMVNSFASHVKGVYEMEMFYGDETLNALMSHAISFGEQLQTFEYIYSLATVKEDEGNNIDESTDTDTADKNTPQAQEKKED